MRLIKFFVIAGAMLLLAIAAVAINAQDDNNTPEPLQPPLGPFSLIAPRNHAVFTDPAALTSTVWTSSRDAVTYRFELYSVQRQDDFDDEEAEEEEKLPQFSREADPVAEPTEIIERSTLIYDANINAESICANGLCTFPIDNEMRGVLNEGVFKWVVKAFDAQENEQRDAPIVIMPLDADGNTVYETENGRSRIALNAPFFFAIDTGAPGIPGFPGPFVLYRPRNGAILDSPQALTTTAWTRSAGAISYNFQLIRRDDNATEIANLTFNADDICSEVRCRIDISAEIQAQLTDGIYSWRVFASDGQERRRARNSPSYFLIDSDGSIAPGTLNWIAPTGVVNDTEGNPTYIWQTFEGAASYKLYLARTNLLRNPIFFWDIDAATYCDADVCEVDLTTLEDGGFYWLSNGDYTVYIQPINGAWSGPFNFTVRVGEIVVVSNVSAAATTRPTISWTLAGTAIESSWFNVYVAPVERLAVPAFSKWYSRVEACGTWDSTTCSVQVDVRNGDYHAYIQNWSPGGFGIGGVAGTGFAGPGEFTLNLPQPAAPANLTVVSNNPLILTWTGDANASWHQIWIGTVQPEYSTRYYKWVPAADLGCESGGTCTLNLGTSDFGRGFYSWFILSAGPGGVNVSDVAGWVKGADFSIE